MATFGVVEEKLLESEFFYRKLKKSRRLSFESKFYFSAFVSAARSVTFALQSTLNGHDGFDAWYESAKSKLKANHLAPFFRDLRNDTIHKGVNPLSQVPIEYLRDYLTLPLRNQSTTSPFLLMPCKVQNEAIVLDAGAACRSYLVSLIEMIFDCYSKFKLIVDPQWYFTSESFSSRGKSIEDALEELGFPRNWLGEEKESEDAWRALRRQQPQCQLNSLFNEYIEQEIPCPDKYNQKDNAE